MRLTADDKGRLTSKEAFPPGTTFSVTIEPDGSRRLVELVEKSSPPARLVRRQGRTYLETSHRITNLDVQRELEAFP